MPHPEVVLASSSPRRQELLKRLIPEFDVFVSGVEEEGSSLTPAFPLPPLDIPADYSVPLEYHPTLWAWRKAVDVSRQMSLSSDTLDPGC